MIRQNGDRYVKHMLLNRKSMDQSYKQVQVNKQFKDKRVSNIQSNPNILLQKIHLRYQSNEKFTKDRRSNFTQKNQAYRSLANKSPIGRKLSFKGPKYTINRMFTVQSENQRLIKRLKQINRRKNNYFQGTQPDDYDMKIHNQIHYRNKIRHLKQKAILQQNNHMVQRIMQKKSKTRNPLLVDDKQLKHQKTNNKPKKKSKSQYKNNNSRVLALPPMNFYIN